ncbi:unnamed protein product, partial [Ilex paraguariensis]
KASTTPPNSYVLASNCASCSDVGKGTEEKNCVFCKIIRGEATALKLVSAGVAETKVQQKWCEEERGKIDILEEKQDYIITFLSVTVCRVVVLRRLRCIRSGVKKKGVVENGYEFFAGRQLVTIFSAPNYCGTFDNTGAMMSVDVSLMCSFQILKPAKKKPKFCFGSTTSANPGTPSTKTNLCSSNYDQMICWILKLFYLVYYLFRTRRLDIL